jgi:peptide chain release factor 2
MELQQSTNELFLAVERAYKKLGIQDKNAEIAALDEKIAQPDFWNDVSIAQSISKQQALLKQFVAPWNQLQTEVAELRELAGMSDEGLYEELRAKLVDQEKRFTELKKQLLFSGPYDDHGVILSIHAGTGGTDAQDWADMLLRMYARWLERNNFTVQIIDKSDGEEAGIKSVTLDIDGLFAYGKLRGENGVHRLVRLSPFNADSLRQTSFAKVEVLPKIAEQNEIEIDEKELKIDVYRAGGHGGQSVNTTDSAVRITHLPTGIVVAIQNERSQLQNRETALTILRSKLAQLQIEQHKQNLQDIKGPNEQAAWGNQIRNYVLHPYKQVKDLRTRYETSDAERVLDGDLDIFIEKYLEETMSS